MLHFLAQKNRRQVIGEYLLRLSIFALLFISIAAAILVALFLPSFFFVEYKNAVVAGQAQSINLSNASKYQNSVSLIKNINATAQALSSGNVPKTAMTDLISTVTSLKNKNITLSVITIAESGGETETASVSGISATRDDLTSFYNELKGDGRFQNIILPVSSLINATQEPFTITFSYTTN